MRTFLSILACCCCLVAAFQIGHAGQIQTIDGAFSGVGGLCNCRGTSPAECGSGANVYQWDDYLNRWVLLTSGCSGEYTLCTGDLSVPGTNTGECWGTGQTGGCEGGSLHPACSQVENSTCHN